MLSPVPAATRGAFSPAARPQPILLRRYSDLLEAMSAELKKSNFRDQDPQMSCSMQFDLNRPNIKVTI